VLWLFFVVFLRYLACMFFFSRWPYIYRLFCPTPHSISKRTPVHTATSIPLRPLPPLTCCASCNVVTPTRISSRVQSNHPLLISQLLLNPPLPTVPALSIDTLLQFPPLLDLGRNHSHVAPTSHSSSCSTWLLCSYAFTFSVYCFGAVLWKKENEEDRILRDVVTVVDNICIPV
jgi:hypothetical protein